LKTERGYCIEWLFLAYFVEEVEWQQFPEVSTLQTVGDCSIAAIFDGLGWQGFHLNFYSPDFFNTIG
jgi:hypothetical protein